MRRLVLTLATLAALGAAVSSSAQTAAFKVVVHPDNPTTSLTAKDVSSYLLLLPLSSTASDLTPAVEDLVRGEMRRLRLPGAAVAWLEDGQLVWARGFGSADPAAEVPVTPETRFAIGSTSKVFVALATLQLVERGELALDDAVVTHLPELGELYSDVTLRRLLSHTAGVARDAKRPGPAPYSNHQLYGAELLEHLGGRELEFSPGAGAAYSNLGPALAALVVERVSGRSLADYLKANVFEPAKMSRTLLLPPTRDPASVDGLATGAIWSGSRPRAAGFESRHPSGSIVSTVGDLAAFLEALWEGRLLPRESVARMWTVETLADGESADLGRDGAGRRYLPALGWFVHRDESDPEIVHHGGSMEGFSSEIDLEPGARRAVIVLANNENGPAGDLAWALLDHARRGPELAAAEARLSERLEPVPLDLDGWRVEAAEARIEEHLDRPSLVLENGLAWVEGLELTDGVIDFDVAFSDERGFLGVVWRLVDSGNYEQFYLRPHQSGNPDANQYTPAFDRLTSWQLYHGPGFGAPVEYRFDDWNRVRVVISGQRAEIYVNDLRRPLVSVAELKRPIARGAIGFSASTAPARFSALRVLADDPPPLGPAPEPASVPDGTIASWQISDVFRWSSLGEGVALPTELAAARTWRPLETEASGLANLARVASRDSERDAVFARVALEAEEAEDAILRFGYSDRARIYLNGRLLYAGDNGYRSRDYRYLGTIGYFDAVALPLRAGGNELWVAVGESFGGWGLQARLETSGGVEVRAGGAGS